MADIQEPQAEIRKVTIEFGTAQGFVVREGDKDSGELTWDEMLGTVAELTHPHLGSSHYPLQTEAEWKAQAEGTWRK